MKAPEIAELIARLEADLAALKRLVANDGPLEDGTDEDLRRRAAARAEKMRGAR